MNIRNKIIQGEALQVLKTFPDECVNMCITSPPYWGLRDYGIDKQLGLEKTFTEYIDRLVNIFDEVKRVLAKDGTCFVNIGDTYSSNIGNNGGYSNKSTLQGYSSENTKGRKSNKTTVKLKKEISEKSLCMIPQRFAIKMIDHGWILRNVIIWHKPSCMPCSVKDRFTVDFEYLYFFTKNKKYYFEQQLDECMTDINTKSGCNFGGNKSNTIDTTNSNKPGKKWEYSEKRNKRCVWPINTEPLKDAHFAAFPTRLIETPIKAGCPVGGIVLDPFIGSGTTAFTAKKLQRDFCGIELNPEYIKIINKRLEDVSLLMTM